MVLPAALLALGILLAGCAGAEDSGTLRHRMRTWADGTSFGESVGSLQGDAAAVAAGYRNGRASSSLANACNALALDAQNANDSLPSPDAALTQQLALAYQLDYEAGTACYSNQSAGTMRKAMAQHEPRRSTALRGHGNRRAGRGHRRVDDHHAHADHPRRGFLSGRSVLTRRRGRGRARAGRARSGRLRPAPAPDLVGHAGRPLCRRKPGQAGVGGP